MKYSSICLCVAFAILDATAFAPVARRMNPAFRLHSLADATTTDTVTSASQFSGAGPDAVDMNMYNLPLDVIATEWTANVQAASSLQDEGIFLGAKSKKEIFVDTVKIEVPRRRNEGLGIELLEIAGGRLDGLGITVVSGLVEGGCADNSGILEGDSISVIAIKRGERTEKEMLSEIEEETAVSTECLGYDATVEAIGSLPPAESDDEIVSFTIKRLRRKPKVTVKLQYPPHENEPDTTIELFSGENLRRAMLVRGVKLNDALSKRFDSGGSGDCGADGTCATCVVDIVRGAELLNPIQTQEQQILTKHPRRRMACKTVIGHGMQEGEMTIRVNPRQWD